MLFCETIEISYDELKNFKMKEKSHKPFILCINKENIKFEFLIKINNSDKVADNSSKSEVVNVGNTAFTVPLILSIIGLVILLTGSGVVIYSLFNRKKVD